jgi:hypothetical protein
MSAAGDDDGQQHMNGKAAITHQISILDWSDRIGQTTWSMVQSFGKR